MSEKSMMVEIMECSRPVKDVIHDFACEAATELGHHTLSDCVSNLLPCDMHQTPGRCFTLESDDEEDCSNRIQWRTTGDAILSG